MQTDELLKIVQDTLDERKGINIITIDVQGKTSVTDFMVLATGNSERHVKSLCDYVAVNVKAKGFKPIGMEGETGSEWVLLDLGDVVLHVMTMQTREFYQLEKLWTVDHADLAAQEMYS
jgi:ribosome-associated protein